MSEERRVDREGIHIDRELADSVAIEEELDANVVGVYRFPSPERRRLAGWVSLALGLIAALTIADGWTVAIGFGLIAAWQFASAWPLEVDEHEALRVAAAAVEFPVGHASAAVRFHGWRSRPRWAVVLYSALEPPDKRALVVIDAVSRDVVEPPFVEAIDPV
ncbi:MAG: hypothetical protein R3258_03065 [Acidimicrobiia bacterium]|nr:hypothetical protein [Acidimicrobiia bacterium]